MKDTFKVGDIVVSLATTSERVQGGIYKILHFWEPKRCRHIGYKKNYSGKPDSFRLATSEEIDYFNNYKGSGTPNKKNLSTVIEVIKEGDIVVMVKAGGWGYNTDNNGCLAKITGIRNKTLGGTNINTQGLAGEVINPNSQYVTFNGVPVLGWKRETIVRKATQSEIDKLTTEQKEKFGIIPKPTKMEVGQIYTVTDSFLSDSRIMVGRCIKANVGSDDHSTRGRADVLSNFQNGGNRFTFVKNTSWCYKDTNKRFFRLATQEERGWFFYCERGDDGCSFDEYKKLHKPNAATIDDDEKYPIVDVGDSFYPLGTPIEKTRHQTPIKISKIKPVKGLKIVRQ